VKSLLRVLLPIVALFTTSALLAGSPTSPVPYETALGEALRVAAMNPSWTVMRCEGDSMTPYFGEATLMLVQPARLADLRPGMIAVYRDSTGDMVAHNVISIENGSVTTRGVNNDRNDPESVNEANLVGVAFGLIHGSSAGEAGSSLPVARGKRF